MDMATSPIMRQTLDFEPSYPARSIVPPALERQIEKSSYDSISLRGSLLLARPAMIDSGIASGKISQLRRKMTTGKRKGDYSSINSGEGSLESDTTVGVSSPAPSHTVILMNTPEEGEIVCHGIASMTSTGDIAVSDSVRSDCTDGTISDRSPATPFQFASHLSTTHSPLSPLADDLLSTVISRPMYGTTLSANRLPLSSSPGTRQRQISTLGKNHINVEPSAAARINVTTSSVKTTRDQDMGQSGRDQSNSIAKRRPRASIPHLALDSFALDSMKPPILPLKTPSLSNPASEISVTPSTDTSIFVPSENPIISKPKFFNRLRRRSSSSHLSPIEQITPPPVPAIPAPFAFARSSSPRPPSLPGERSRIWPILPLPSLFASIPTTPPPSPAPTVEHASPVLDRPAAAPRSTSLWRRFLHSDPPPRSPPTPTPSVRQYPTPLATPDSAKSTTSFTSTVDRPSNRIATFVELQRALPLLGPLGMRDDEDFQGRRWRNGDQRQMQSEEDENGGYMTSLSPPPPSSRLAVSPRSPKYRREVAGKVKQTSGEEKDERGKIGKGIEGKGMSLDGIAGTMGMREASAPKVTSLLEAWEQLGEEEVR